MLTGENLYLQYHALEQKYDIKLNKIVVKSLMDYNTGDHLGWIFPGGYTTKNYLEALSLGRKLNEAASK
jgi:hypothetical protein